jgi:hypothetical protein
MANDNRFARRRVPILPRVLGIELQAEVAVFSVPCRDSVFTKVAVGDFALAKARQVRSPEVIVEKWLPKRVRTLRHPCNHRCSDYALASIPGDREAKSFY